MYVIAAMSHAAEKVYAANAYHTTEKIISFLPAIFQMTLKKPMTGV